MLCEHLIKTNVLHICIGDQQPSKSLLWPRQVNAMRRIANQCHWSLEPRGFSPALIAMAKPWEDGEITANNVCWKETKTGLFTPNQSMLEKVQCSRWWETAGRFLYRCIFSSVSFFQHLHEVQFTQCVSEMCGPRFPFDLKYINRVEGLVFDCSWRNRCLKCWLQVRISCYGGSCNYSSIRSTPNPKNIQQWSLWTSINF